MTTLLLLAGCGGASPCHPATAGDEPYCAMVCAPNDVRDAHACPGDLPHRTDLEAAAVCRAEPGPPPEAICAQLPGRGCGERAPRRTGPRCEPDNPLCLPQSYEGCVAFDVEGPRHPADLGTSHGACAHDGECVVSGCGNDCAHWTETGDGTCEGYLPSAPTFCGCVAGSCAWFTQ